MNTLENQMRRMEDHEVKVLRDIALNIEDNLLVEHCDEALNGKEEKRAICASLMSGYTFRKVRQAQNLDELFEALKLPDPWHLVNWNALPKFGADKLLDKVYVASWDDTRILLGRSAESVELHPRVQGDHVRAEVYFDSDPKTLTEWAHICRKANDKWWRDLETGEKLDRNKGELLCLIHSEISEVMEGERKGLMDDHLPHRKMAEVELADALIRIFDYAGEHGYDLESALREKMEYNAKRHDHSHEARKKDGGKKF